MGAAGRASPLGDGAAVKGVDGRTERLRKVTSPFKGTGEEERDNSEEGSHLFHSVIRRALGDHWETIVLFFLFWTFLKFFYSRSRIGKRR